MTDIDWIKFGEVIKTKRKEKRASQLELANAINSSQPVISLAERGSPIGMNEERIELLIEYLKILPEEIPQKEEKRKTSGARKKVFISYSHKDREYFDRLKIHLKPLEKQDLVESWSDNQISAGQVWKTEIDSAIKKAQVAVLLISADFLASDFIINNELPPLLERASKEGATIIPVILKPCRFVREKTLSKFQSINSPEEPLIGASELESELIYDAVAQRIESLL
jgi:transcriptional regulator with XRE-family HTH domain